MLLHELHKTSILVRDPKNMFPHFQHLHGTRDMLLKTCKFRNGNVGRLGKPPRRSAIENYSRFYTDGSVRNTHTLNEDCRSFMCFFASKRFNSGKSKSFVLRAVSGWQLLSSGLRCCGWTE